MKILWTVNNLPPQTAKQLGERAGHSISWVEAMSAELKMCDGITLAIAAGGHPDSVKKQQIDGVTYYLYNKHIGVKKSWEHIISDFQPDIIHTYGTEQRHNMPLIEQYKEQIPIVISIQGIINEYKRRYLGGLSLGTILRNYTMQDLIWRNGILAGRKRFYRQSAREAWMFSNVRYVEGRSDWDRAMTHKINPKLQYHHCPRMIRAPFFDYSWSVDHCEKHSIFVHQGNYPIKGMHFMLEALAILKKRYPDVRLYVSGADMMKNKGRVSTFRTSGYAKLICRRILELGIDDCITFTGYLDADSLARKLSCIEVCAIPSVIENAPNALAESMVIGVPCVASDVGGNADMLGYGEAGLLYCYDEPEMLADRISRLFDSRELKEAVSDKSRHIARKRHDPQDLKYRLLGIYEQIIADFHYNGHNDA